ncbi:hypothetical protein [Pseudoalteromonas rhizosphaerae]|uniref:Uncharacterized protein n=1 Tax=Pseudoalteromonas rhizosphaerae TaxID=2518973 RepID=A0ABW8KW41_9GAMM
MLHCKFNEDDSICSTIDYEENPDKYRGLIYCIDCGEKAWFTKGYETQKISRMACFGAKHKEGCNASTVEFVSDDPDNDEDEKNQNSGIRVDLDKVTSQSIYVSNDNNKHGDEESDWKGKSKRKIIGNSDGFPLSKSLRQLLTNLCRNSDYGDENQTITIVANSGRVVVEGDLRSNLVRIEDVSREHIGKDYIFWGKINNLNIDKKGTLWLNYGDNLLEPSIALNSKLKEQVLVNFKLKEVSELDGSDVIIVGHVGFSPQGKAIISTGFTKYMSFRRVTVK